MNPIQSLPSEIPGPVGKLGRQTEKPAPGLVLLGNGETFKA